MKLYYTGIVSIGRCLLANNWVSAASVDTLLQSYLSQSINSNKQAVQAFCATVQGQTLTSSLGTIFEADTSIFVHELCRAAGSSTKALPGLYSSFEPQNIGGCKSLDRSCSIDVRSNQLYADIMDEYMNSKMANLYGLTSSKPKEQVSTFSTTYFNNTSIDAEGKSQPLCRDPQAFYLNPQVIADPLAAFCSHPKTHEVVKNTIMTATALIQDNTLIDYSNLTECAEDTDDHSIACAVRKSCTQSEPSKKLHCMMAGLEWSLTNEMVYYQLFMRMYATAIENKPNIALGIRWGKSIADSTSQINHISTLIERHIQQHMLATRRSMQSLKQMMMTFPLHIGLTAYLEDVVAFRKQVIKMYTPLHQLHYKLKNVQELAR